MASFFGIPTWFHKNVAELSGGQKQLLNLAAVMVMQPSVLILDEPTSQLDPIAAGEFIATRQKINRELGTTVILSEHRLEDAFPASDRVIVMDSGSVVADGDPATAGAVLKGLEHHMYAALMILLAIPLTIYFGIYFLDDRKYYFISLLIMAETMLPFCMAFESRKPQARELVIISVLCAITVAGRTAFFMLPQFKPVVALVIIAGVCFGGETGFLVGAVTGFVSNFFFGQGPWTPWQMFCFGIIGFVAGLLFRKGMLRKNRTSLCIFGFAATLVIYGGIMNPSSVIMVQSKPTWKLLATAYASGLPLDLVHSASTAFFLLFISEAMIDKLERIKVKYGLIER